MPATARAQINRQNAGKSTGPKTMEGKARSSANAVKHRLSSNCKVLPWEKEEDYQALQLAFCEQYRPDSDMECEIIDRMVDCWWKLQRVLKVENEFLLQRQQAISAEHPELTGNAAIAAMLSDPKEISRLRLMMRYVAQAERAWQCALAEFAKVRKERLKREAEEVLIDALSAPVADSPAQPEVGESAVDEHGTVRIPGCIPEPHYELCRGVALSAADPVPLTSSGFVL